MRVAYGLLSKLVSELPDPSEWRHLSMVRAAAAGVRDPTNASAQAGSPAAAKFQETVAAYLTLYQDPAKADPLIRDADAARRDAHSSGTLPSP